jgi:hypothetical protein
VARPLIGPPQSCPIRSIAVRTRAVCLGERVRPGGFKGKIQHRTFTGNDAGTPALQSYTSITAKYRLARRVQTRLVKPASIAGVLNSAVTTDRFPGFEGFLGLEV